MDRYAMPMFVNIEMPITEAGGDCRKGECAGILKCYLCWRAPLLAQPFCLYCSFDWFVGRGLKDQRQYLSNQARRLRDPKWGAPAGSDIFWQNYALSVVNRAIKKGLLPSLSNGEYECVDCAGVASVYEHRDYGRPLAVVPVCRGCNNKRGTAKWPSAADFNFKRIEHK